MLRRAGTGIDIANVCEAGSSAQHAQEAAEEAELGVGV